MFAADHNQPLEQSAAFFIEIRPHRMRPAGGAARSLVCPFRAGEPLFYCSEVEIGSSSKSERRQSRGLFRRSAADTG
jgi:hypothetical protein